MHPARKRVLKADASHIRKRVPTAGTSRSRKTGKARRPIITPINVTTDRRASAPHPGPRLKREYFDVLGIDVAEFARAVGLDARRLADMLAGRDSIDVDAAIRISRALQLSADALMRMQVRADFAVARGTTNYDHIGVLEPATPPDFPERDILRGRLGLSVDTAGDPSYFFQEEVPSRRRSDDYAGLHALFRGDRLRVYRADGEILWTGLLLHGLDGKLHLPYVAAEEWPKWFDDRLAAELAIGDEHAAFFMRMGEH
jgi:addiction module HigA family antidote